MGAREPPPGWDRFPSLRMGLGASRGKGRIQKAVARAFAAAEGGTITTSQAYDFALARVRGDMWRRMHRCSVLRVLDQVADRVGRDRRHGAIIWRLKPAQSAPGSFPDVSQRRIAMVA